MANEPKTRTKNGKFTKGTSGNPSGRPAGSRNKATLVAEQLLDGESEQLIRKAVSLAKSGNVHALRLCLERVIPIRKERSIDLELPPAQTPQELAANYQRVLSAIGEGRITPGEAQVLTEILSSQARLFESVELERRLLALEELQAEVKAYRHQREAEMQKFAHENKKAA